MHTSAACIIFPRHFFMQLIITHKFEFKYFLKKGVNKYKI